MSKGSDLAPDIRRPRPPLRGAELRLRVGPLDPTSGRGRVVEARLILNWALSLL